MFWSGMQLRKGTTEQHLARDGPVGNRSSIADFAIATAKLNKLDPGQNTLLVSSPKKHTHVREATVTIYTFSFADSFNQISVPIFTNLECCTADPNPAQHQKPGQFHIIK